MRRILIVLVASVSFAVGGCEDSNPASPGTVAGGTTGTGSQPQTPTPPDDTGSRATLCGANRGSVRMQVDGALWTSTCVQSAAWTAGVLTIVATNGVDTMTLGANVVVPGTFDSLTGVAGATLTRNANGATWISGPGGVVNINVARIDLQRAAGTFAFTGTALAGTAATGTRVVTNGSFDVTF